MVSCVLVWRDNAVEMMVVECGRGQLIKVGVANLLLDLILR